MIILDLRNIPMKKSDALILLCILIAVLGIIISSFGLFNNNNGKPFEFISLRGETVKIYGKGLYHYDSYFKAPIFRGTDTVLLLLATPLLIISAIQVSRGSLRGKLTLSGSLAFMLYDSASLAFGAAYNKLFLIYILQFSASFFALAINLTSFDINEFSTRVKTNLPFKRIAFFLFFAALSTTVWLASHVDILLHGGIPAGLASYTTDVTAVLDLGIILPSVILTGILLLKRKPLGIILSSTLLILLIQIGFVVVGQTMMQMTDGIKLTLREIAAFVAPFIILSLAAVWMESSLIQNIREV
jgi:hypothetical protein